jgi:hypothetical protein
MGRMTHFETLLFVMFHLVATLFYISITLYSRSFLFFTLLSHSLKYLWHCHCNPASQDGANPVFFGSGGRSVFQIIAMVWTEMDGMVGESLSSF